MEGVEAKRLVAAYVQLYPLFQAAYQELGYPHGYFNDRLVQAIDDLLATPDVAGAAARAAEGALRVRRSRARGALGGTEDHAAHGQRERGAGEGQAARDQARDTRSATTARRP